jgi:cell division protein ZapA
MEKLSIKIKIGDREYPMKVVADEEARIRKAGKLINEKIKIYREKFGIDDKQDLLAMVAFDSVVDKMEFEGQTNSTDSFLLEKLKSLNTELSKAL